LSSGKSIERSYNGTTIYVTIHEARGLAAADLINAKSDPYVRVQLGNRKFDTKVTMGNLDPCWNENFEFNLNTAKLTYLILRVYDYDTFTNGTDIGRVMIPLIHLAHGDINGWFPLMRKSRRQVVSGELRVTIRTNDIKKFRDEVKMMEIDLKKALPMLPKTTITDSKRVHMIPGPAEKVEMRVNGVVAAVYGLRSRPGTLLVTNFRLIFLPHPECSAPNDNFRYHPNAKRDFCTSLPYRFVASAKEVNASALRVRTRMMEISCVDFRRINLIMTNEIDPDSLLFNTILKLLVINLNNDISYARMIVRDIGFHLSLDGWDVYNVEREYKRQGINSKGLDVNWKLSDINHDFSLCPSYPQLLLVPKQAPNELLKSVGGYRSKGRIPAVTWYNKKNNCVLVRCAQPMVGLMGKQSKEDQLLLEMFRLSSGKNNGMLIFDCRSGVAAKANEILGKGSENSRYYENCKIMQGNIANIHAVRKSLSSLSQVCTKSMHGGTENWFQLLSQTNWLQYLTSIITAASTCAYYLEHKQQSVIVHCSDGWDRTAQVSALAQILLDPYYRTIEGLIVLVEKDWLSFGFKFMDRSGMCNKPNEKSPVFVQWLDCLHQVLSQFPTEFEYTEKFLQDIWINSESSWFGTFLFNTEQERMQRCLSSKSISIWATIAVNKPKYLNKGFAPSPRGRGHVLMPISDLKMLRLWGLYLEHSDIFWSSWTPWSACQIYGVSTASLGSNVRAENSVMWVPDEWANNCRDCRRPFTLVRRRHHCRACGHLFCSRCTSSRLELPELGYAGSQRVCNSCTEVRKRGSTTSGVASDFLRERRDENEIVRKADI